jgi:hypothetical protein
VVNGRAVGSGFVLCQEGHPPREFGDKSELVQFLSAWPTEASCVRRDRQAGPAPEHHNPAGDRLFAGSTGA